MLRNLNRALVLVAITCSLSACGGDDADESGGLPSNTQQAISSYSNLVRASYEDSLALAVELKTATSEFTREPTAETLEDARAAWKAAREPYLQTEAYRFYEGPIDNEADGPEGMINAWPLDEAYIDYVAGDEGTGIINDPSVELSEEALEALNEQGGEKNIATGYHAIEFLLWGQDQNADGPGARPFTDYLEGASGSAPNSDRRRLYLDLVSALLVDHLQQVTDAWAPGVAGNFRAQLESGDPKDALTKILTGLTVLSGFETGGERLQTALDSGDQEDEHSCFSDNTHRDMVQDVRGISNVWHGSYTRLDGSKVQGVGVREVVAAADAQLAKQLDAQIAASLTLAEAIQPPFDQEIASDNSDGRARLSALITSLREQARLLEQVFVLFELDVPAQ